MSANPADRKYSKTHEWFLVEGDVVTVGITKFAADELTDITYVDLPAVGSTVKAGQSFGEVESVKAVADLNSPLTGEVIDVNMDLADNLESLSSSPFEGGWMIRIKVSDMSELDDLMDLPAYEEQVAKEEEE